MRATRTKSSRHLPMGWHREPEGRNGSRTLSDECLYPREHLGSKQKPSESNAGTIHKTSSEMKHEHRKEEQISIATSTLDTRVGSWRNLFGRRRIRVKEKQVRPQRDLPEGTNHASENQILSVVRVGLVPHQFLVGTRWRSRHT